MAGVGKLLKQAQKMQRTIEQLNAQLAAREIDVTSGGGAVKIKISGTGEFRSIELDPELLKEDPKIVGETLLVAVQDAAKKAQELHEAETQKVTGGMSLPGLM
jgi:DNA-binding YbaB/EbfC family protein